MIICYRYAILAIAAMLVACTTNTVDDNSITPTTDGDNTNDSTPAGVIEWMDEMLSEYYLYNSEYNSMERDMDRDYDEFLEDHLLSMSTNVFDKKWYDYYNEYSIYSYIDRESTGGVSMSRSLNATELGYGVVNFVIFTDYSSKPFGFGVLGVYPDSPAERAGVVRGDIITKVGSSSINSYNYYSLILSLLYPSSGATVELTMYDNSVKSITAETIEPNPILKSGYLDQDEEIGYIAYAQFNSSFDDELRDAVRGVSGAKELILDLRINGGGYNSSAVIFGSAIRGSSSATEVFSEYVYNSTITNRYTKYDYFKSSEGILSLPVKRIYCLVSSSTASASELLINALEGIGYDVILIGDTTKGKNVGMFIFYKTSDGYTYELAPICFASKNAAGFYEYQDGFSPDYYVNEYNNFTDYGVGESLVDAAIYHIENGSFPVVSVARSGSTLELHAGEVFGRNRPHTMIMEIDE
ncbi:MAG: S41 family peptidase [Rikenellaceae bacterium]